jgi:regulator of protease activity HflC (stomatin/prohibitin superfamily)
MLPTRRPRLVAQRRDAEARRARAAAEQRARELEARKVAQAIERDRARKRRAARPLARALETAGGWILSILGALVVSLALTWLLRHPQTLDSLMSAVRSILRLQ